MVLAFAFLAFYRQIALYVSVLYQQQMDRILLILSKMSTGLILFCCHPRCLQGIARTNAQGMAHATRTREFVRVLTTTG